MLISWKILSQIDSGVLRNAEEKRGSTRNLERVGQWEKAVVRGDVDVECAREH